MPSWISCEGIGATDAVPAARAGETGRRRARLVLVVDDDAASRAYLTAALEAMGCCAVAVANAGEALGRIRDRRPDTIVSDFMMPGLDGLEFLALVRREAPEVPLILVSACDRPELAAEAQRQGARGFLQKPVRLETLRATLESLPPPLPSSCNKDGRHGSPASTPADSREPHTLLRKTSQLSYLTQYATRLLSAAANRGAASGGAPGGATEARPPMDGVVDRSLDVLLDALNASHVALVLAEANHQELVRMAGRDRPPDGTARILCGAAQQARGAVWCGTAEGRPAVAAPLAIRGGGIGHLAAARESGAREFAWADAELLAAFAAQTALALENLCFARELERACQEAVVSLIGALEARHHYTHGHSHRVSGYAAGLATAWGLSTEVVDQIRTAGLLHDLGKVAVRDAILDKPGPLSPEEMACMRDHAACGAGLLAPLRFLADERAMVRHHHERWDGRGYPDGLSGEAIPLGARLIAVADAFDAMCTLRPYRPPLSPEAARLEVVRGAGSQFDPRAVQAFEAWWPAAPDLPLARDSRTAGAA